MAFPLSNPFRLFQDFPGLDVAMIRKEHMVDSDEATARVLGVEKVAAVEQTHGNGVVVVRDATSRDPQADGLITNTVGLTLTVRWGDCQNFVVYAPEHRVAGLLHAGWRGLVSGIIPRFYHVLEQEWGIAAAETYVGAGPSLCLRCSDFTDPAKELPAEWAPFFRDRNVDLQGIATAQFAELGVLPEHFEQHPDCTRCRPDLYWTWRGGHKEEMNRKLRNVLACRLT